MTTCGNHSSFQRSISEPPARHSHAEIERTLLTFGVGLGIDAVERQRLANVVKPPARRLHSEIERTMLTFGVGLGIDAEERQRRKSVDEPPARRSHAEIERTMLTFGVGLDIDAVERQKRKNVDKPEARHSHTEVEATMLAFGVSLDIDAEERQRRKLIAKPEVRHSRTEIEGTMLAFGVGLDIDAVEQQRRKMVGDRQQPNGQVLPDVDVSHSWDLPVDSLRKVVKAERRPFWEQTHWAKQWALLMDRPRRGNRSSSWKPEVRPKQQTLDDLPDDIEARLHEITCDLDSALAKKHGKTKMRGPCTQTATKSSKGLPMPKIWDALYDAAWRDSFEKSVEPSKPQDSSCPSTASGDVTQAPSPEVWSSTFDTAESFATDSDDGGGVFHIVNDPKGKHALLRNTKGNRVASSCQSLAIPLSLRRVMCAVLPSDPESSLQLSGDQMHKLIALHSELQAQKRSSAYRPSKKRAGVV